MRSDVTEPLNLGSDVLISMNDLAKLSMSMEGKDLKIVNIDGPQGVRGRNSDNTLIREKLGWAPSVTLEDGLRRTYFWIKKSIETEVAAGANIADYRDSHIVHSNFDDSGEKVRGL